MKRRLFVIVLCTVLSVASSDLGEEPPRTQSSQPQPTPAESEGELRRLQLLRIESEMTEIAQDLDVIDTQMMRRATSKALSGDGEIAPKVHELLQVHNAFQTIKVFLDSSGAAFRWEACLKTVKLYRRLWEMLLELGEGARPGEAKSQKASSIADESPETVQVVFLVRMMAEWELRSAELGLQSATSPDVKQQERWRKLREALQNDDRTYREKLNAFWAKTGASPRHFGARTISAAQGTSSTAATAVIGGMGIFNPEGDTWRIAELPGVNPDFVRALECERKAMQGSAAVGSGAAFIEASRCRRYPDGAEILAFGGKRVDSSKPTRSDATFGATFSQAPRPKIPSWWIRCDCPDDHPDAGMVVDGVRWHAPVLHCPNPELKVPRIK